MTATSTLTQLLNYVELRIGRQFIYSTVVRMYSAKPVCRNQKTITGFYNVIFLAVQSQKKAVLAQLSVLGKIFVFVFL